MDWLNIDWLKIEWLKISVDSLSETIYPLTTFHAHAIHALRHRCRTRATQIYWHPMTCNNFCNPNLYVVEQHRSSLHRPNVAKCEFCDNMFVIEQNCVFSFSCFNNSHKLRFLPQSIIGTPTDRLRSKSDPCRPSAATRWPQLMGRSCGVSQAIASPPAAAQCRFAYSSATCQH